MYKVVLTNRSVKDLKKIGERDRKTIGEKIKIFSQNPLNHARKLNDKRIGDYRIVFDLDGDTVVILRIGHRKNIYQ